MEKVRAETPYLTDRCLDGMRLNGVEALQGDCVKRLPPTRWRGLWRDNFEGPQFCPPPAQKCVNEKSAGEKVWLEIDPRPAALRDVVPGGLYAVEFIGRKSSNGTPREAYGYQQDIVVDHLISVKQIEAPPKG